ncbi:MAG: leucine-rich repeat domain-containing protein, partial [Spirochaetaceae bacterium]|nr:leucine-rich repeat domain-containing protein [Spirochaetaceae bacterium]
DLSHCTSIGNWAFQGCTGISGSINLSSCSSIGTNAFTYCSGITGVTELHGTIGDWAFYDTGLTGAINMANVTSVGDNAFKDCSQITSITGGLHGSIGDSAFEGTGLTGSIDMSGATSIGDYAFNNLSGISGTLNLSNCSQIGESAFQGCSGISGVTGLNGTIGDSAFRDTELSGSIDMANVTSVGSAAFAGCHISGSLDLSNCTTIGPDAFAGCVGVTGITIGSSVTSIDAMAFYSCGTCDYTFLKDPNSITYGAGSAIYGGATATWTDNGTNHTYTWNSSTKHWDAPQIGSKAAPTAVGDIVFSDGSATPYTDFNVSNPISELQKQQAVAIIFKVDGTTKYGVGINESGDLQWAPDAESSAFTTAFTSEEDDGSRVWEDIICVADTDATNDPATNYPAFNYALTYTAPGYTSCWYLPAINELSALYNYRSTVNSAVSIIGNTYPIIDSSKNYWSSTQDDLYPNVRGIKNNTTDDILKLDTAKVRVICKFY